MNPTLATSAPASAGTIHSVNIEYIFYFLTHGGTVPVGATPTLLTSAGIVSFLTMAWIAITIVAYLLVAGAIALLVYSSIRMYQIEDMERIKYATFPNSEKAEEETEHHRWTHVRELIESASPNDWRQAIIEADIILDDMLTRLGYSGNSIGDKLKMANPAQFRTIQEAWEAHKVRNEIAHQGSEYPLTDHIAYRTILQYENVFKEHGEI